jgi:ariadne-1
MERFYDGDQEALFKAAHVINPYVKPKKEPKVKKRFGH